MNECEHQVADALLEAMPITEGPALQHRRRLAEILAVRVAAAIQAAAWWGQAGGGDPEGEERQAHALAVLRGPS